MKKIIFLSFLSVVFFTVNGQSNQKISEENQLKNKDSENSKLKSNDFDKKYQSSRALEIHYIDVSDNTNSDSITIDNEKYKYYLTKQEAVDEFINAHLKRDLTIVYVKKKEGQKYKENPEYFEITE